MTPTDPRALVDRYLDAYNRFDVDGMMDVLHPDVVFENRSGGDTTHTTRGADSFRALAEEATGLFASRRQTVTGFLEKGDAATAEIQYEGVPAADLPDGPRAGETLRLAGRSTFVFRDGLIARVTDES